ncbi:MAG: PEGA domain-containing protein [Holophagales bacterium]|nr:PEGA domain-containing protein [Holophagales bacterium]
MNRAPFHIGTLLAALVLAGPAAAVELPKFGVISRPRGFSSIRVVAAPGLSVFLDDAPAGTTDALRQGLVIEDLPAGTYTLRVEKPGFEPKLVKVTVAEGDTKDVRILGLKPKATPTPFPPGWTPPPGATPAPTPVPVRAVILDRKNVSGGTLVTGVASGATDVLPLIDGLKSECACTPALEEMKKRKDGLYEFRVMLPRPLPKP